MDVSQSTVWITHEQMKRDAEGVLRVMYDTSKAEMFGARRTIFQHHDIFKTPEELVRMATSALAEATEDDWMAFTGAPELNIIAALCMYERTCGTVNLLIYDKAANNGAGAYVPRRIKL